MPAGITITIKGDRELIRKLEMMSKTQCAKAIRPGLRAGQKIITATARANSPVASGLLRSNIKTRAMKRKKDSIGILTTVGEGWYAGKTFYGAFQEFGWKTGKRATKTSRRSQKTLAKIAAGRRVMEAAKSRRQIPGKHYMENAAKAIGQEAGQIMVARIAHDVEQLAKNG
jgi:HK97 gp10 family phage protein